MIASVLSLDRRAVQHYRIRDAYSLHRTIYSLFPGDERTFLYYDQGGDARGRKVLIVSQDAPEPPEEGEIQSKRIPEEYLTHGSYAFQVRLNPVVRKTGKGSPEPVKGREDLRQWFLRRQGDWGFRSDENSLEISDTGVQEIETKNRRIVHNVATFRGILTVEDPERFEESFKKGIGRGKAFGFGLLQIKPVTINNQ